MSRTPFLIVNFLDLDVYVVMIPIFPANQRRCASFSKNVAILPLWSKRATIAANNLIDSQQYTRHTSKISGRKRSVKITDRFTCTSGNIIYRITCTLCNKFYIGETGRRQGDLFREHLRDLEKNDKDASKPVARHFNLPNHSKKHMAICGLSLHLGTTESRKNLEQKFIFQIGTLNPHGINERFSFN